MVLEVQARHPGRCNLPQSVSGENPRQNHSQRVSGERKNDVKQHWYEDSEKYTEATMRSQSSAQSSKRGETMKRTESKATSRQKSKANSTQEKSKANGRQKRKANGTQEKCTANGRQSKPKDCDRDKARYEEKYTVQSKTAATHPTSDTDVQQGQIELKLDEEITTIPKNDFDEEIVEYEKIIPKAQKHRFRKSRRP